MTEMLCIKIVITLLALGFIYLFWQLYLAKKYIEYLLIHSDYNLEEVKEYVMNN